MLTFVGTFERKLQCCDNSYRVIKMKCNFGFEFTTFCNTQLRNVISFLFITKAIRKISPLSVQKFTNYIRKYVTIYIPIQKSNSLNFHKTKYLAALITSAEHLP
jgi:hypothetical protein